VSARKKSKKSDHILLNYTTCISCVLNKINKFIVFSLNILFIRCMCFTLAPVRH
jgi:hypothetical protein